MRASKFQALMIGVGQGDGTEAAELDQGGRPADVGELHTREPTDEWTIVAFAQESRTA